MDLRVKSSGEGPSEDFSDVPELIPLTQELLGQLQGQGFSKPRATPQPLDLTSQPGPVIDLTRPCNTTPPNPNCPVHGQARSHHPIQQNVPVSANPGLVPRPINNFMPPGNLCQPRFAQNIEHFPFHHAYPYQQFPFHTNNRSPNTHWSAKHSTFHEKQQNPNHMNETQVISTVHSSPTKEVRDRSGKLQYKQILNQHTEDQLRRWENQITEMMKVKEAQESYVRPKPKTIVRPLSPKSIYSSPCGSQVRKRKPKDPGKPTHWQSVADDDSLFIGGNENC